MIKKENIIDTLSSFIRKLKTGFGLCGSKKDKQWMQELNHIKNVHMALKEAYKKTDEEMDKAEIRDKEERTELGKSPGEKHIIKWMGMASDFMKKPNVCLYGDIEDIPKQLDQLIKQNEQQYEQQQKELITLPKD